MVEIYSHGKEGPDCSSFICAPCSRVVRFEVKVCVLHTVQILAQGAREYVITQASAASHPTAISHHTPNHDDIFEIT